LEEQQNLKEGWKGRLGPGFYPDGVSVLSTTEKQKNHQKEGRRNENMAECSRYKRRGMVNNEANGNSGCWAAGGNLSADDEKGSWWSAGTLNN